MSAREIQKEFGLTYNTASRMLRKINDFINTHPSDVFEGSQLFPAVSNQAHGAGTTIKLHGKGARSRKRTKGIVGIKFEEDHTQNYRKRDRTARLLRLQVLLAQSPLGLNIKEIAFKCYVSERTAYRDLKALEYEVGIPIWERGSKRGIVEGHFLYPF